MAIYISNRKIKVLSVLKAIKKNILLRKGNLFINK